MASSADFIGHVQELLAPLGGITVKRMFSGHGVYVDGVFMAIIAGDELYLKTDSVTRADFEAEGCSSFVFYKAGKEMATSYFRAPGAAMDTPSLMRPWAKRALEAALRARGSKPAPKNKPAAKKNSSRPAIKKRTT